MPLPTAGRSFTGSATLDDGPQDQETLKVDHRWSDKWTTTGMYGHQHTKEPGSAFWGPHGTIPADPSGTTLFRTVNFFSTNQIIIPNNTTAVAVRYGYNRFLNDGTNYAGGFDAASLGYPAYLRQRLADNAFPSITMTGYSNIGHGGRSMTTHRRQTANATVSKFMGNHSVKVGADYRRIEAATVPREQRQLRRSLRRSRRDRTPNTASTAAGDAFASFLLGYPPPATSTSRTPGLYYTDYYSAFIQDDWRASSIADAELRPALRVRAGHRRRGQRVHGRLRSRGAVPGAGAGDGPARAG